MAGQEIAEADSGRLWHVTISELIHIFRQALIDLIPTFDRARIEWRGDQTYDDFERVAEALYDSIVRDAIESAQGFQTAIPLARYGLRESKDRSWILVNDPSLRLSLYQLASSGSPFDTIECVPIDSEGKQLQEIKVVRFDGARFLYEARFPDATTETVYEVDVEL